MGHAARREADITRNVALMQGVLARLPEKFTGSIRGEIILTKSAHETYFPDKVSTRNAAAGTAKRYDGKGCKHLNVMFYRVADGKDFETEGAQFEWLEKMGFKTPHWYVTAMAPGVKTPHDIWVEYQQSKRAELPYDIDGLVVGINSFEKQLASRGDRQLPGGCPCLQVRSYQPGVRVLAIASGRLAGQATSHRSPSLTPSACSERRSHTRPFTT